jgi:hypothetical protein
MCADGRDAGEQRAVARAPRVYGGGIATTCADTDGRPWRRKSGGLPSEPDRRADGVADPGSDPGSARRQSVGTTPLVVRATW